MAEILKKTTNPKGVGLAATQVGLDKRFFILLDEKKDQVNVFVNPVIMKSSKKTLASAYKKKSDRWLEGCLSIPGIWGFVNRPFTITLKYQIPTLINGLFELVETTKEYADMESAYTQHEIDHLDGILFTDRAIAQRERLYQETDEGLSPLPF